MSRSLAVRFFPFATVPAPSPLPASRMDSRPLRGCTGGRAASSAKVLIPDTPLPAIAPRAETPVRIIDNGRDDDTHPSVLGRHMDCWKRLRCWLSVLLSCPPSSSPCNDGESYLVGRRLHGRPRGVSGRPQPRLHNYCGGSSICIRRDRCPWLYFSPLLLQLAEKQDLEILSRISRSCATESEFVLLLVVCATPYSSLSPSGQRERHDTGQGCRRCREGGPIIAPVGARETFPFLPLIEGSSPFALRCCY